MPNLNEFLNKDNSRSLDDPFEEKIDGTRPCSKCDLDVDGGIWNPEKLLLTWVCKNNHHNSYQIN